MLKTFLLRLCRQPERLVCLLLMVVTLAIYWPVQHFEFINYDDWTFVSKNPHLQNGLTWHSVRWALSTGLVSDYHGELWIPVTYLSHLLTIELFGMSPSAHHLVNVGLHLMTTLLLFLVFRRMTGALWPSACVAALFAVHPLHVESVAWVTERKDVLSTLFWMLTLWAYTRYTERRTLPRYFFIVLFFVLGLLSKPMLVTLPLVLLLLDYWPLGRYASIPGNTRAALTIALKLVWEKIPLFALMVTLSVVSYLAQSTGGVIRSLEAFSLWLRIENSMVSYVSYIGMMVWPAGLTVFYPHPGTTLPPWHAAGAMVLIAGVTVLVVWVRRQRPYLAVGWFWYIITLVPVIGVVQIGDQALADRFTYVPLTGLFLMCVWGIDDVTSSWRHRRPALIFSAGLLIFLLAIATRIQVGYWKNSLALFEHAIEVTTGNYLAHNNLGLALENRGRVVEAIAHYNESLRIRPTYSVAHYNLGVAHAGQGNDREAISHYTQALTINPTDDRPHNNLGVVYAERGDYRKAIPYYSEALRINPENADAHSNIGVALVELGNYQEAMTHYAQALKLQPEDASVHSNLGIALARQGRLDEALPRFHEAVRLNPGSDKNHNNLGLALLRQEKYDSAIVHFSHALKINPSNSTAQHNLGEALSRRGE